MTKTILTALLGFYSFARFGAIWRLWNDTGRAIPKAVLWIALTASVLCLLLLVAAAIKDSLAAVLMRSAMLILAVAALCNLFYLRSHPVGIVPDNELFVVGTFLDPLFFLGTLTIPIRPVKDSHALSPFVRAAAGHKADS